MEIVKLAMYSAIGTVGFSMLFGIRPKHVPFAALGGTVTTVVYLFLDMLGMNLFVSSFLAALLCVTYSTVLARILKTPSVVFITAGVIPLVPGGLLFYTMSSIIMGDKAAAAEYGMNTLLVALGIAGGVVIESLVVSIITKFTSTKITPKH